MTGFFFINRQMDFEVTAMRLPEFPEKVERGGAGI